LLSISRIDMLDALTVTIGASVPYVVNEAMKATALTSPSVDDGRSGQA
jgi:hypothetical protein